METDSVRLSEWPFRTCVLAKGQSVDRLDPYGACAEMTCTAGFLGRPCGKWRTCDNCAYRRRRDQAWCMRAAGRARGGDGWLLLTMTAPGDDVLPRGVSGLCEFGPLAEWSGTMVERWKLVRANAHGRTRYRFPNASTGLVLAFVWQLQRRGAPHIHAAVSAGAAGRYYASVVKEIASDYGFGFVDILTSEGSAPAVASYLSSYMTSENGVLPPEYVGLLPSRRLYINRNLQASTGATMEVARKLRRLWVFANVDSEVGLPAWRDELQRAWVYYWYRANLRGIDNVALPAIVRDKYGRG